MRFGHRPLITRQRVKQPRWAERMDRANRAVDQVLVQKPSFNLNMCSIFYI